MTWVRGCQYKDELFSAFDDWSASITGTVGHSLSRALRALLRHLTWNAVQHEGARFAIQVLLGRSASSTTPLTAVFLHREAIYVSW